MPNLDTGHPKQLIALRVFRRAGNDDEQMAWRSGKVQMTSQVTVLRGELNRWMRCMLQSVRNPRKPPQFNIVRRPQARPETEALVIDMEHMKTLHPL
jgi:hypothetical protein